jgi:hypothetical protein
VSLVAAALESRGIASVTLSVLPEIAARLQAPRTLLVPFGLGTPVGPPLEPETQVKVVSAALALAYEAAVPIVRAWSP